MELFGERIAARSRYFVAGARCWQAADAWFVKSVVPWPQAAAAWLFAEPPAFGRPGLAPYSERSAPLSPALGPEAAPPVGVDGPQRHRLCQNEVVADFRQRRPSVEQISRVGMDTSKRFFQLHGVNAAEEVVLRKKLRRKEMVEFFQALAPTVIGIEACGSSHHWARLLRSFGHEVKLIAPQLVKPYVKRGKNDGADAE